MKAYHNHFCDAVGEELKLEERLKSFCPSKMKISPSLFWQAIQTPTYKLEIRN